MGKSKEKYIEELNKDPKNWITKKCVICGTPHKINTALDVTPTDEREPFTCSKCLKK